jgi:hypothetical protein
MQQSSLTWPTIAHTIQTRAETVTTQISTAMDDAVGKLTALTSEANYSRHDLSHEAEALLNLRDELDALLNQGQVLTASPYQFQVGSEQGAGYYLTPQSAIATLTAKLREQVDKNRPMGELYCIALLVSESQLSRFAETLTHLTAVLPFPDWCQVARQASALSTHSEDKLYQPASIVQPRFKPQANLHANPLRELLKHQGAQIATLESLANDQTNVIEKLQVLAEKRTSKLTEISVAIERLKNLNECVWSHSLTGTTQSIATQLNQMVVPNNNQYTVASLLISSAPLLFFEELLCSV